MYMSACHCVIHSPNIHLSPSSCTAAILQFGVTPMHLAVNARNVAAVRELLQLNCDVSLRDMVRVFAAKCSFSLTLNIATVSTQKYA